MVVIILFTPWIDNRKVANMTFCPRARIYFRGGSWEYQIGTGYWGMVPSLVDAFTVVTRLQQQIMAATLTDPPKDEKGIEWAH